MKYFFIMMWLTTIILTITRVQCHPFEEKYIDLADLMLETFNRTDYLVISAPNGTNECVILNALLTHPFLNTLPGNAIKRIRNLEYLYSSTSDLLKSLLAEFYHGRPEQSRESVEIVRDGVVLFWKGRPCVIICDTLLNVSSIEISHNFYNMINETDEKLLLFKIMVLEDVSEEVPPFPKLKAYEAISIPVLLVANAFQNIIGFF